MALQPKNEPVLLVDAQGRICNQVLEAHARDFTLQFLHHTINGAPLDSQLLEGRLVDRHEMLLTVTPTDAEIREYEKKPELAPSVITFDIREGPENMTQHRFTRIHNRVLTRGALSETIEVQRQSMMLATEHALDAVMRSDQSGFNEAQRDLDTVISLGSQMLTPLLREAGVPPVDRDGVIKEIHEEALTSAVQNRKAQLDEHDAQALTERWEEYSQGYEASKAKGKVSEVNANLNELVARKPLPYSARISMGGRDMIRGPMGGIGTEIINKNVNDNKGSPSR